MIFDAIEGSTADGLRRIYPIILSLSTFNRLLKREAAKSP